MRSPPECCDHQGRVGSLRGVAGGFFLSLAARLELHRRDIRPGDDEVALHEAHREGGHGSLCTRSGQSVSATARISSLTFSAATASRTSLWMLCNSAGMYSLPRITRSS